MLNGATGRSRGRAGATGLSMAMFGLAALAAGCGGGTSTSATAPSIEVVTGLYPLAQAIEQIGGPKVTVVDVVPAGSDPRTYQLTAAQVAAVRKAAVVVEASSGFQPSLTAAAAPAAAAAAVRVVDLDPALATSDPYVWLDPDAMQRAVATIAAAMEAANPPAAGQYRSGAQGFSATVASTGIDYENTLSACPRRLIVTPDAAFAGLARRYGLTDQVVGAAPIPDQTTVTAATTRIQAAGLTTVFSEPFVSSSTIAAVAAAAHVKVRPLDPLTGPPPAGWPRQADYLRLMEANLGALNSALGCPDTGSGT
jgi:zinc transport system substrate-binding protein